ncbi:glycosyltransferase family 2 protein [Runella zeae]|uniref:glycosyltransferase family 2 protein n=1 Tax=Runella zeae TaxID=94255 RepID=UPI0004179B75|nr:glycosyltransferase family 2 protein [Runella zeae]
MNISVCIPTYNQGDFIEEAILSAFNQTLTPQEIIVYDDCSTDNTSQILNKLKKEIAILKVFSQPVNQGIARNVDMCLRAATGKYIVRLDSDDILLPDYLKKLTSLMEQYPEAAYAHGAVQEIDKNGNFIKYRNLFRKSGYQFADEALRSAVSGYRVAANIILFRKSALEKVGYIASKVNFGEDYYLAASLAAHGFGNIYLNELLAYYRVWVDKFFTRPKRKLAEIQGYKALFEEILTPAFTKRGWGVGILNRKKMYFACNHAESIASDFFSEEEKKELSQSLLSLSSHFFVTVTIWVYNNNLGIILKGYKKIKFNLVSFIKKIIR